MFRSALTGPLLAAAVLAGGCSGAVGTLDDLSTKTYMSLRYSATVRQALDFTCGSAALATILTHYWGRPTTEFEILQILRDRYPDGKIWKQRTQDGFSFDDIAFVALVLGYESAGAKIPVSELKGLNGPVIVHLDKGKFQHFSVLRRVHEGVYYMADPTVGQIGMEKDQFETQYTGNAMAVWMADRKLPASAPLMGVRDGLSLYSAFGKLHRDVEVPRVTTF